MTVNEVTPTTEEVKNCYVYAGEGLDGSTVKPVRTARSEFDRWLAAHNRKIAAEALREAAREMRGDGKRVLIDAEESAEWLDNYADGFEQGGES